MEQKINPCKGDWVTLIKADMNDLQITMDDKKIQSSTKRLSWKKLGKKRFWSYRRFKKIHMKVKYINFKDLSGPQSYLSHRSFSNKLTSLLFDLRCRNIRCIKDNFTGNIKVKYFVHFCASQKLIHKNIFYHVNQY